MLLGLAECYRLVQQPYQALCSGIVQVDAGEGLSLRGDVPQGGSTYPPTTSGSSMTSGWSSPCSSPTASSPEERPPPTRFWSTGTAGSIARSGRWRFRIATTSPQVSAAVLVQHASPGPGSPRAPTPRLAPRRGADRQAARAACRLAEFEDLEAGVRQADPDRGRHRGVVPTVRRSGPDSRADRNRAQRRGHVCRVAPRSAHWHPTPPGGVDRAGSGDRTVALVRAAAGARHPAHR